MRKICVVVGSRANYSSVKSVMTAVKARKDLELQVVAGASAVLDRYGAVVKLVEKDGFAVDDKVYMLVEGETPLTMAQSTGLGLIELAHVFDRLKPDVVVTVGDRFETMATAVAASYMNIPLAHTMGGEVTGTIDESVRHAITKLAHIHFPANRGAAERILKLGEDPSTVHVVGCPRMDLIAQLAESNVHPSDISLLKKEGVGGTIDFSKPYILAMQHPVTTEYGHGEKQVAETIAALEEIKMPTVMLWPNADAGSEDISRGMRKFREHKDDSWIRFYKNLPVEIFIPVFRHCAAIVGNSSAAIREGSFLGIPAVNVGSRQQGRDRGKNVMDVGYDRKEITDAVRKQMKHGPYENDGMYGDGHAGEQIAEILSKCPLSVQKRLTY